MAAVFSLAIVLVSTPMVCRRCVDPLVQPLLAIALAFVGQLAWQYFVEGREKRQVKKLFSRYVPKDVYDQLMETRIAPRSAAGGATMTVLFSDVRGFTAMSEKATPEEVVGQLNEYFSRMVQVLFEHRGTLDKFVGDMVMGLFGAPLDDPDHAEHAVQTAIAMSRRSTSSIASGAAAGRPTLDIGIGISTGEMVAGNIGSEAIMSYTVIGDRVNLGARLESLNKDYGTRIIISEATREALKGRYDIHPLGEVVVKGKSRPGRDLRGQTIMKRAVPVADAACRPVRAGPRADASTAARPDRRRGQDARSRSRDLQVTEAEEQQIGAAVSEKVRMRYGVVQDANVHRYVALVGTRADRRSVDQAERPVDSSSCSTPTRSMRLRLPAVSCTSRAARWRCCRTSPSWPACSATRSSTSPSSTPSARSRRARASSWAPTKRCPATPRSSIRWPTTSTSI